MSTREQSAENTPGNSFGKTASKAAAVIDEQLHWGADTVSSFARQTADHVDRATDYVQKQGQKIQQKARKIGEVATEHPNYVLLAVGVVGFTLGFLLRGRGRTAA
jgi:ElaB/YqjD/DUF883 family membrane-anchored ribosome-binding protein